MTVLVVDAAGPATSIQDTGRVGQQRHGLGPGGAMDRLSLAKANVLAGQPPDAAAIEIGPFGASFSLIDGAARIAIAGAERSAHLGPRVLSCNAGTKVAAGTTITIGPARRGVFSYLAIGGGIVGRPSFGSLSVNARAGLGSPYPRPLRAGDRIAIEAVPFDGNDWRIDDLDEAAGPIRVVLGPQDDHFPESVKRLFLDSAWTVSPRSDRMGYRLDGPHLNQIHDGNIVSDGTVNGAIQVPASGQPLVLLADRGTTGGYPKLGVVVTADLGRFCQTPAGATVRFAAINVADARASAADFLRQIERLPERVRPVNDAEAMIGRMLDANLAGAAVNALAPETWQDEASRHDAASSESDGAGETP
jgi:biotin-dependent carboxylase-like uncharacterized protein